MASFCNGYPGPFQYKGLSTVNEEATEPVLEFVNAFGCGSCLALRNPSRQLIDSLFLQFLPMARRVPGYRQDPIVR